MCGPLQAVIATQYSVNSKTFFGERTMRQLGRICAYTSLGLIVGVMGQGTVFALSQLIDFKIARLILFLLILVILFCKLVFSRAKIFREWSEFFLSIWRKSIWRIIQLLPQSPSIQAFASGWLWFCIPCGMVYTVLVIAASSTSIIQSGLAMTAFGIGTVPALMFSETFAQRVRARFKVKRNLGVSLISVIGILMLIVSTVFIEREQTGFWSSMLSECSSALLRN